MSAHRLRLAAEARADLREIQRYSKRVWGEDQRQRYAERLTTAIASLARHPDLGHGTDAIAPGLRALQVREPIISYCAGTDDITIVRVLHRRVDSAGELPRP